MAIEFDESVGEDVVAVTVSGKLTAEDYERFVPEMERLIREHGKIRILFVMRDFHGWTVKALWEDTKFDLRHFADIRRLAMVGEKRWQQWMATFCKPFTSAEIRYFTHDRLDEARQWAQAG